MVEVRLSLGLKWERGGEDITPHIVKKGKIEDVDEEGRIEDTKRESLESKLYSKDQQIMEQNDAQNSNHSRACTSRKLCQKNPNQNHL